MKTNSLQSHIFYLLRHQHEVSCVDDNKLLHFIEYDLDTMAIVNTIDVIQQSKWTLFEDSSYDMYFACYKLYEKEDWYIQSCYLFYAKIKNGYLRYIDTSPNEIDYIYIDNDGREVQLLFNLVDTNSLNKFEQIINSYILLKELSDERNL